MSENTKGKLEYHIVATNSIDIVSKEDESDIVASVMSEDDELGDKEKARAKELVRRWNSHDELLEVSEGLAKIFPENDITTMDAADFKDRAGYIFAVAIKAKAAQAEAKKE